MGSLISQLFGPPTFRRSGQLFHRDIGRRRAEGQCGFWPRWRIWSEDGSAPDGSRPKSPGQKPCVGNNLWYFFPMPLTNLTVAEEALSLSPEDRAALARLMIESLETDSRTDSEIKAELNCRLEELLSKRDAGLAFHEVFGRAS